MLASALKLIKFCWVAKTLLQKRGVEDTKIYSTYFLHSMCGKVRATDITQKPHWDFSLIYFHFTIFLLLYLPVQSKYCNGKS
jgi:hypothetical protein